LTRDDHLPEAIAILQFSASLYPDSSDAFGHLAGAYAKSGQKQLAIDNYKKALEKNPENPELKKKLEELQSPNPGAK
jgi:tetratricopeptide (TPR) repeat protein